LVLAFVLKGMEPDQTKEQLRERIETLEAEIERLREQQTSTTRRFLIRGAGGIAGATLLPLLFGSASAARSGTYPVDTDDPFFKLRLDRLRYISRSSKPSNPDSGRVIAYIDDGDLP
jgi:hypothetical protein